MENTEKSVKDLLGHDIGRIFDHMKWAEEVIESKIKQHPAKREVIWGSFKYLSAGELLHDKDPKLYYAHCEEIIGRRINGVDIAPGTNAEIAALLCEMSQVAPLDHDYAYVYQVMFKSIFGNVFTEDVPLINESYKGRSEEIISRLRKKLGRERDCHKQ